MYFSFGFHSSLLLIFFFHGLVYAFLLYRRSVKETRISDRWLAFFLLLCCLYIAPWMLGFGGWYDTQPYRDILFYTPFQHLFLLGPVIFFYTQSLLNPSFRFSKKEWIHFLPAVMYIIFSAVMLITDKIVLKKYFFLADGEDPDFDWWYQYLGFISMLLYFTASLRYYNLYRKMIVQAVSYADTVLFKWVKNFLMAFLAMLMLKFLFEVAVFIPAFRKLSYAGSWWDYFSFALIFYYIAIRGYSNSIETKVPFRLNLLNYKQALLLPAPAERKSISLVAEDIEPVEIIIDKNSDDHNISEDAALLAKWKPLLLQLLEQEKIFENPELSLTGMARLLKTNPAIVSKVINQGFGLNFNDFINQYRIEAVKQKLTASEHKIQTLLGIAFDCGFNSKATFNRAFKKAMSQSPKEWLEKHIQ